MTGSKPTRSQVTAIIRFAIEHCCIINPIGYGRFAESFNMFNACPCDKSRKACPCPQAPTEIGQDGHCTCQLFWRDYETYWKAKFTEG